MKSSDKVKCDKDEKGRRDEKNCRDHTKVGFLEQKLNRSVLIQRADVYALNVRRK